MPGVPFFFDFQTPTYKLSRNGLEVGRQSSRIGLVIDRWRKIWRSIFIVYVVLLHLAIATLILFLARIEIRKSVDTLPVPQPVGSPNQTSTDIGATSSPATEAVVSPEPIASITPFPAGNLSLIIPVAGVHADQLVDTFASARGEGRIHDAIDIMAPAGTPVLAAVDGRIIKFFDSIPGGITIYQLSEDRQFIYYYAHLQRRADNVKEGDRVAQGATIAFVGDTGNAGAGNYHLHFSIARVIDPKRYWEGTYVNPYPYLRSGTAPQ